MSAPLAALDAGLAMAIVAAPIDDAVLGLLASG